MNTVRRQNKRGKEKKNRCDKYKTKINRAYLNPNISINIVNTLKDKDCPTG